MYDDETPLTRFLRWLATVPGNVGALLLTLILNAALALWGFVAFVVGGLARLIWAFVVGLGVRLVFVAAVVGALAYIYQHSSFYVGGAMVKPAPIVEVGEQAGKAIAIEHP